MQHPDVFLSNPKWPRGKGHFGWFSDYKNNEEYLEEFQHASNEKMIGEKTTDYLFCPHTAERIKRFSPNAKIIMILRNPVDMMFSLHGHYLYNEAFEDQKDFEEALKAEEGRKKEYMDLGMSEETAARQAGLDTFNKLKFDKYLPVKYIREL